MIGKNWEIVGFYKDMLIFYKTSACGGKYLVFGNKCYQSIKPKNIRSAKNLITRYINKLNKKKKKSLKYLRFNVEFKEI